MTINEDAVKRKNKVLSDSSRRLNSLVKGDYDSQPLEAPTSFAKDRLTPRDDGAVAKAEEPMSEEERRCLRLLGVLQLISYFLSVFLGGFLCYVRHQDKRGEHLFKFLASIYAYLDETAALGEVVRRAYNVWDHLPQDKRAVCIKTLTYGSIFANVFPMVLSARKANAQKAENKEAEQGQETERDAKKKPAAPPSADNVPEREEPLIQAAAAVTRFIAATVLCVLVGFDVVFNAHLIPHLGSLFGAKV